jgi:DNA primase
MAFSSQFLDELRTRVGLVDTVGRKVKLTRRGREHTGLCPFHKEKTPSFTVNEEKGFYHCFGCGAHGSAIDFVMNTDGVSFPEAVERLAATAGMEVPADTPAERDRARRAKGLHEVLEAAAAHYEKLLRMPEGRAALAYLHDRGLGDDTIKRFRLGFAPDGGTLKSALARDGFSEEITVEAGLVIRPDEDHQGSGGRKPYERFRRRVMFPIEDARGRTVGFGGRVLGEGEPKYLNSPETPVFHKGRTLYALVPAREASRAGAPVIVSEGYMDVIALHQAGFRGAVAPLGTALTEDQIALLWRIARDPVLCFDGDAAGGRAAARAAERALPMLQPGFSLRFALLPAGEDPDSLIKRAGATAMSDVLDGALSLSDMLWRMEVAGRPLKTPDDRAWLEKRLADHARTIADATVRDHYLAAFKDRLWQEFRRRRPAGGSRKRGARPGLQPAPAMEEKSGAGARVDMVRLREEILVAALITHPELFDAVDERLGALELADAGLDKVRQEVLKTLAGETALEFKGLYDHLCRTGFAEELEDLLSRRVYVHASFARLDATLEDARAGWEETFSRHRQYHLLAEIKEAERRLAEEPTAEAFQLLRALKETQAAGNRAGPIVVAGRGESDDAA